MHSIGGGTGSGLGSLIISKLAEENHEKLMSVFSIFPSQKVSDVIVEPYNAGLSIHQLIENSDFGMVFDNEKMYDICKRSLNLTHPTYADINYLIACTMSGITCSLRFPGQVNSGLRKLTSNLVPFARMHFLTVGYAPLLSKACTEYVELTGTEVCRQMFDPENMLCAANPTHGKYYTGAVMFRGKVSKSEIEEQIMGFYKKNPELFCEWIPDSLMISICDAPPKDKKLAGTFIGNSTAMHEVLSRIATQFGQMFRRKAFVHWYTNEGMDEMEFTETESNIKDLISEYQQGNVYSTSASKEELETAAEEEIT